MRAWWLTLFLAWVLAACRPSPTATAPEPTAAPATPTPVRATATPLPPTATPTQARPTATAAATATPSPQAVLRLRSPAFDYGQPIPTRYTCDGQDLIPPLTWEGAPAETQSFVLIMEDPDAPRGTWDHWIVYDIPPTVTRVEEGQAPPGKVGRNSWGNNAYGGPCPPPGPAHRYFFRLYALSVPTLGLPEGATKAEVLQAMEGRILAQAEYMGVYGRE